MTEDRIPGLIESLSDRISPSLCVGPAPRTMEDLEYLKTLHVTGVLNVSHQKFDVEVFAKAYNHVLTAKEVLEEYKSGPKRTEEDVLEQFHIDYHHIPTVDGKVFKLSQMLDIIETVNLHAEKIGANACVYIHCNGGISRSPAAIALIFIGFGHDPDKTLQMLERKHPQTLIAPDIWKSILKHVNNIKGKTRIWWQTKEG